VAEGEFEEVDPASRAAARAEVRWLRAVRSNDAHVSGHALIVGLLARTVIGGRSFFRGEVGGPRASSRLPSGRQYGLVRCTAVLPRGAGAGERQLWIV
jgi:hypothetical protein